MQPVWRRQSEVADAPIAQRELVYRDEAGGERPFLLRIDAPRRDGDFWACGYELGAPAPFAGTAYGEDSLQALVLALHAVKAHLDAPELRGRVLWLGAKLTDLLALPGP
jgi:hypothetical protein